MRVKGISRRQFIQSSAITTCSLLFFSNCSFQNNNLSWRFFTSDEALLMDAIVEQIIPSDEWPGAKDAKVTNYIDRQLSSRYKRFQEDYRNGLNFIKLSCEQLFNETFENIYWDKQTQFLKDMEAGSLSELKSDKVNSYDKLIWIDGFERTFFNLLRDHTMQGFYGSPRHGGNKDYVSYRMIGLDSLPIIGQNRYK